jgi:HK97 gp10 family phage protein
MAAAKGDMKLLGARELQALLAALPRGVAKRGLRAAVTAGATPITRAAKARAPRKSGLLKKAIGRKVKTYKEAGVGATAVAIVGARRDVRGEYRGRPRVPARYIHLVEKGTRPHDGHPGTPATNFLEDAYRGNKAAAEAAAARKLAEVVEREARKLGKR